MVKNLPTIQETRAGGRHRSIPGLGQSPGDESGNAL